MISLAEPFACSDNACNQCSLPGLTIPELCSLGSQGRHLKNRESGVPSNDRLLAFEQNMNEFIWSTCKLLAVILQMLSYGCTRLEIGLQSTYEDVARDTNRGHTVAAVGECFQMAKNAGFKVNS